MTSNVLVNNIKETNGDKILVKAIKYKSDAINLKMNEYKKKKSVLKRCARCFFKKIRKLRVK